MTEPLKDILLVEDNADDVELIELGLQLHHLANRVVIAHDGEEAINAILGENCFRLVMLDLKLPKLNGLGVLKKIRANARTKNLPVVILTSSTQPEDMLASYDGGANSYVRKSVDFNEFAAAVAAVGLYWTAINEAPCSVRFVIPARALL